jgi:hypothetical protein
MSAPPRPRLRARARLRALALSALLLGAASAALAPLGCSAESTSAPGQLTVVLRTNMTPGRDFDALRMSVTRAGAPTQSREWTWTVRPDGTVDGTMKFPSTVAVVDASGSGAVVVIRVEASRAEEIRVVREARLALPSRGNQALPLLLDWFCLDGASRACAGESTCVAGTCDTPEVGTGELLSYDANLVFPDAGATGEGAAACFDVLATFANARTVTPTYDGQRCGFPWSRPTSTLNVAVRSDAATGGICGANACLVPLDAGTPSGWIASDTRVEVPRAVCSRGLALVTSTLAPSKRADQSVCGSWSSVGAGTSGPATTIVLDDADAGPIDAGGVGDTGPRDAATPPSDASDGGATCAAPYVVAVAENLAQGTGKLVRWSFATRSRCPDLPLSAELARPRAVGVAYDDLFNVSGLSLAIASETTLALVRPSTGEVVRSNPIDGSPRSIFDIVSNGAGTFAVAYTNRSSSPTPGEVGRVEVFNHRAALAPVQTWAVNTGGPYSLPLGSIAIAAFPGNQGQSLRVGNPASGTGLAAEIMTPSSTGPQSRTALTASTFNDLVAAHAYRTTDRAGHYALATSGSSGVRVHLAHTAASATTALFSSYVQRCGAPDPTCTAITRAVASPLAMDEALAICEVGATWSLVRFGGASTGCTAVSAADLGSGAWRLNDLAVVVRSE